LTRACIYARAVSLKGGGQRFVHVFDLLLRDVAKAERPDESISWKSSATGNLRDPACRHPTVELELPEPVLRVTEALTEPQVLTRPRVNVRHSPAVTQDLNLMIEARQAQRSPVRRQRASHEPIPGAQGSSPY
jgi:hypothetical protein